MNAAKIRRTETNASALRVALALVERQIPTATFAARPALIAKAARIRAALAVSAAR